MKPQMVQGEGIHEETADRFSGLGLLCNLRNLWLHGNPKSKILRPLAAVFGLGSRFRLVAYRQRWLKTRRLNRPVVSIGNLTVGGTGKTPFVAYLAKLLLKGEWMPGILTRGYGRRGPKIIAIEPGLGRHANPREVGDEPALLAKAIPEVPIVVGADRYRTGRVAEDRFRVDVHLLDDGFQHLALARDVDVVLLDSTHEHSEDALLPAGRQREPYSALRRADFVVLTRTELADSSALEGRVRGINPQAEIFHSRTKLCSLVDVVTGRVYPPAAFSGEQVHAFCGIANPKAFFGDLRSWGFSVGAQYAFRDHKAYEREDLSPLVIAAGRCGASALITTEKDAINLPPLKDEGVPILACVIETELMGERAFEGALLARLLKSRAGTAPRPAI